MDVERLLAILLEETELAERGMWYESGCDVKSDALNVLADVIRSVQYRLKEDSE